MSLSIRGPLHWDIAKLRLDTRKTLSRLQELESSGIGVDAWGVDYALLGEHGELLLKSVSLPRQAH